MITKETMLIIKSNQKMLDIINTYMQDDMKKLKPICHKVWEGKVSTSEYEDLYDVATDCLIESVVQYDHSKSSFKTFLTGNIMRKTSTWIRDNKYTLKSSNLERDKNGKILRDEDDIHKRPKRIENISLDAPMEDGGDLKEMIPGTFKNLYDELFYEDLSDIKIRNYLSKLSDIQREILSYMIKGYETKDIQKLLHISKKDYGNHIAAIQAYENVRELM